jgi:hypothetical protein
MGLQDFLGLFTSYSHHCPSRPASGLRLEIGPKIDKKKSEFYFSSAIKKILTEKTKRHCPGTQNQSTRQVLTELPHTRIFSILKMGGLAPGGPVISYAADKIATG